MEISQKENIKRGSHGGRKTKLYHVWCSMKRRCFSKGSSGYRWYGARGITVCEEWRNDFACFRAWALDNGYKEGLSIERKNNDGDYCPENCRWATNKENCLNKQNTMSDEERYNICPVCGKRFVQTKRNGQQTCSVKCGQVIRKSKISMERNKDGTFKSSKT